MPDCRVIAVCDAAPRRLEAVASAYPMIQITQDHRALLRNPEVNAVVIATPLMTHYALVKEALEAGKDVLVEKPICYTAHEAQELVELAETNGRILMCRHVFLFNTGV